MPTGLSNRRNDELVMRTSKPKLGDGHVDGDVLERLLKNEGMQTLQRLVREVAERDDRAGVWVRAHREEELSAVEEVVGMLRTLLDLWI